MNSLYYILTIWKFAKVLHHSIVVTEFVCYMPVIESYVVAYEAHVYMHNAYIKYSSNMDFFMGYYSIKTNEDLLTLINRIVRVKTFQISLNLICSIGPFKPILQ